MYRTGDLQLAEPGWNTVDARDDNYHPGVDAPYAYLSHSCNEWVGGGLENLQALLDDVQRAIAEWPA